MGKSKKALIQTLATKHSLPLSVVEKIVNSQFKYVGKVMGTGMHEAVRLPYFGKFSAKPGRIKHLTKLKNKKDGAINDK